MRFYGTITKIDTDERMVWGYASTEAEDGQGEVVKREALAAALADYMRFANIREMHRNSAVGIAKEADIDDRGLYIGARIVDDAAWAKVVEGVYKGFSIGGRVTARDPADRTIITGVQLTEISVVDRPANPDAVFDCWKAEANPPPPGGGGGAHSAPEGAGAGEGAAERYADLGWQPDGKKRYRLDTPSHIRAAWAFIHMPANARRYGAAHLAAIKSRIAAAWAELIDPKGPPAMRAETDAQAEPDRTEKATDDLVVALDHIQRAHDLLCRAGAFCPGTEFARDPVKAASGGNLAKSLSEALLPRLDALAERVEAIARTPLPPATMVRAPASLSKRDDGGGGFAAPDDIVTALARMSDEDRTLALIKAAHLNPIRPRLR